MTACAPCGWAVWAVVKSPSAGTVLMVTSVIMSLKIPVPKSSDDVMVLRLFREMCFDDVVVPRFCEEPFRGTRDGGTTFSLLLLAIHVESKCGRSASCFSLSSSRNGWWWCFFCCCQQARESPWAHVCFPELASMSGSNTLQRCLPQRRIVSSQTLGRT